MSLAVLFLSALCLWRIEVMNEKLDEQRPTEPVFAGQRLIAPGVTTERWMTDEGPESPEAWKRRHDEAVRLRGDD